MARVKDIINQWGKQGGPNPQRSDLWQVDLSDVIDGLNENANVHTFLDLPRYYHATVSLPEQKIKAEPVRRDSRSYNMPSWDEPLDAIRMTFVVDDGGKSTSSSDATESKIYTLLDSWRSVTRAGRGGVGSESSMLLNASYRIDYAFPVYIYLLKGQTVPVLASQAMTQMTPPGQSTFGNTFDGSGGPVWSNVLQTRQASDFSALFSQQTGLDVSGILRLENAWIAGFKLGELAYERSGTLTIEATIYADNILQIRRAM